MWTRPLISILIYAYKSKGREYFSQAKNLPLKPLLLYCALFSQILYVNVPIGMQKTRSTL